MNNEECLAQYFYDLITAGKYKIRNLFSDEAHLQIRKNWLCNETLWIETGWGSRDHVRETSHFIYRNINIVSPLAFDAFGIIKERQSQMNHIDYNQVLGKMVQDLNLEC